MLQNFFCQTPPYHVHFKNYFLDKTIFRMSHLSKLGYRNPLIFFRCITPSASRIHTTTKNERFILNVKFEVWFLNFDIIPTFFHKSEVPKWRGNPTKMTSSEAFVETMVAHGTKHVFGIVGSAFMDPLDIFEPAGIRFVSVQHEQNAVKNLFWILWIVIPCRFVYRTLRLLSFCLWWFACHVVLPNVSFPLT